MSELNLSRKTISRAALALTLAATSLLGGSSAGERGNAVCEVYTAHPNWPDRDPQVTYAVFASGGKQRLPGPHHGQHSRNYVGTSYEESGDRLVADAMNAGDGLYEVTVGAHGAIESIHQVGQTSHAEHELRCAAALGHPVAAASAQIS